MSSEEVDAEKILSAKSEELEYSYNQRDIILYALGIGECDPRFTVEQHEQFSVFPLYPVVLGFKGTSFDVVPFPPPRMINAVEGMPMFNPAMILHGEQSIELFKPLDAEGALLRGENKIISFLDKGKGALMETETTMFDKHGDMVCKLISGTFIRGLTGFKGKGRTPQPRAKIPERQPDAVQEYIIPEHQALLYRLSGDYNPLHADMEMAQSLGFEKPILHGLCSMGYATRSIYHHYCEGDPSKLKLIKVRFSKPLYPGETIVTEMWKENNKVLFLSKSKERDIIVIEGEAILHNMQSRL